MIDHPLSNIGGDIPRSLGSTPTTINVLDLNVYDGAMLIHTYQAHTRTLPKMIGAHFYAMIILTGTTPNTVYPSAFEDFEETPPVDPGTSYIVLVQAKNRYGLGPAGILVVPKYNGKVT